MSKVLVNFIQDRSGSMGTVWQETLSGFRQFVRELKEGGEKDGTEYLFSLTTFDTLVETPIIAQPIASISEDALDKHGPRGSTALYDAVGTTIRNTEDNSHGADKIIVVIVTDGHENSSREWTKDSLHAAVEAKLNKGNWTFTYLGTQPETWDDAAALGVHIGSVASYTPTMARAAYTATSQAVRSLGASTRMASRKLMHDFVPAATAMQAGMQVKGRPGSESTSVPTPSQSRTKVASKRWR